MSDGNEGRVRVTEADLEKAQEIVDGWCALWTMSSLPLERQAEMMVTTLSEALSAARESALREAALLADAQAAHCRKIHPGIEWSREAAAEQCEEIAEEIRALLPPPPPPKGTP